MTSISNPASTLSRSMQWMRRGTVLAGLAFSLSWIIGLCVFASSTTVVSTGADVIASYSGHLPSGALQYLFTEGLPPVAILIVVGALARRMRVDGHTMLGRATWLTALFACIVSFIQFALGLVLVAIAVPADNTEASAGLSDAVTRLDGVKMLVFAGMAVLTLSFLIVARRSRPAWLAAVSALLAVTIVVSGFGYLLTMSTLATAAYASLPLLMLWVTGWGIVLGRRVR